MNDIFLATTDTVVGIGGKVNGKNRSLINAIKRRDKNTRLIIMLANIEQARKFTEWNDNAEKIAKKYWPGNITLILTDKLALRVPDKPDLQVLISKIGPIYMTSANVSGKPPMTIEDATKFFKQIKRVYDFGEGSGVASQIIDIRTKEIVR